MNKFSILTLLISVPAYSKNTVTIKEPIFIQTDLNKDGGVRVEEIHLKEKQVKAAKPKPRVIIRDRIVEVEVEKIVERTVTVEKEHPLLEQTRFDLTLGHLWEKRDEVNFAIGARVKGQLHENLGYRLRYEFSPSVVMIGHSLRWQTDIQTWQPYVEFGLGQRIGLKTKSSTLGTGIGSYTTVGAGVVYNKSNFIFEIGSGLNMADNFAGYVEISAMKKFEDLWIGVFTDWRSVDSPFHSIDNSFISTGIKVSF